MANFDDCHDIEEVIYQALGAASTCWQNLDAAGVFDSSRCAAIGKAALARISELQEK